MASFRNASLRMTSAHSGEAFRAPMLRGSLRRVGKRESKSGGSIYTRGR